MKTKRFGSRSQEAPTGKIAKSGQDFETLMLKVPTSAFVQMVGKSGLPTPEARELCASFKDLKGE